MTDTPHAERIAGSLSAALGPVGWEASFEAAVAPGAATQAALDVARRFGASVREATGVRSTPISVSQRPDQLPKYLLILFSRNEQAHWDFADQASKAYVDWLHHCDTADYEANLQVEEALPRLPGFEEPVPERDNIEGQLRIEAERYLRAHLPDVLRGSGGVRPIDRLSDVYGEMLGRARITHLRSAVKALHAAGSVDDDGTGDFWERTIHWLG